MSNLATPTVSINDDVIEIVPNSLSYKKGLGDVNIRTQQAGSTVTTVVNENAESKLSMLKFSMILTSGNAAKLQEWLEARTSGGVTAEIFDGSLAIAFRSMVIVSEPESQTGSEGSIEIEFQGPPAA